MIIHYPGRWPSFSTLNNDPYLKPPAQCCPKLFHCDVQLNPLLLLQLPPSGLLRRSKYYSTPRAPGFHAFALSHSPRILGRVEVVCELQDGGVHTSSKSVQPSRGEDGAIRVAHDCRSDLSQRGRLVQCRAKSLMRTSLMCPASRAGRAFDLTSVLPFLTMWK